MEQEIKVENPPKDGNLKSEVGYKRPPKEFQFKKGQISNPRGKPKGCVSPISRVKQIFKNNPATFKKFILEYIKDPSNRKHIVEMIDGKPKEAIDLTTGGESFFRPTEEEKVRALEALKEIN